MTSAGCCGWNLVYTSRVVLNGLHAFCLVTSLWLILLLSAQCIFFVAFSVAGKLAKQAGSLSPGTAVVCILACLTPG
jgi:hypothetical protein